MKTFFIELVVKSKIQAAPIHMMITCPYNVTLFNGSRMLCFRIKHLLTKQWRILNGKSRTLRQAHDFCFLSVMGADISQDNKFLFMAVFSKCLDHPDSKLRWDPVANRDFPFPALVELPFTPQEFHDNVCMPSTLRSYSVVLSELVQKNPLPT